MGSNTLRWLTLGPTGLAELEREVTVLKNTVEELQENAKTAVVEIRKGYDARAAIQEEKVLEYEKMREEITETYRFLLSYYPKELELAQVVNKHMLRLMRELLASKT